MYHLVEDACRGHADLSGGDRNGGDAGLALGGLLVGDQVERVAREVIVGVDHTDVPDELVVDHQIVRSSIDCRGQETGDGGNGEVHVEMSKQMSDKDGERLRG